MDHSVSSAATIAALQAASLTSSRGNLSSAAAAAALRSHTTSPEPVGSIQTKRMVRRSSQSSTERAAVRGGSERGSLERSNSVGSMSERTFRTPSPARQDSNRGGLSSRMDVPPVPPVPMEHQQVNNSASSWRVLSPPPAPNRRTYSLDRMGRTAATKPYTEARHSSSAVRGDVESPSPNQNSSRNFSRPMSVRAGEEVTSRNSTASTVNEYTHGMGSWHTGTRGARGATVARPSTSDVLAQRKAQTNVQPAVDLQSNEPAKKTRIASAPGSHLSQATKSAASGTKPSDAVLVFDLNSRTFKPRPRDQPREDAPPKSQTVFDPNTRTFVSRAQAKAAPPIPEPEIPAPAPRTKAKAGPPILQNHLGSTSQDQSGPSSPESPSSPRGWGLLHKQPSIVREDREAEEAAARQESPSTGATSPSNQPHSARAKNARPPSKSYALPRSAHARSSSLDVPSRTDAFVANSRGRPSSISPQRNARFSPSPVNEPEHHVPPGRDVSPVKGVLKSTHSPSSSVGDVSPFAGNDDGTGLKKKKSVRVSFEERPTEIASPMNTPSRLTDREEWEDDGTMKPRPALPNFGSIRRQGQPASNERGMSSDQVIGSILSGGMNKNSIVEDSSKPLPPEVTSKDDPADLSSDENSDVGVEGGHASSATTGSVQNTWQHAVPADDADVPAINLQPPTPGASDDRSNAFADDPDADQAQKGSVPLTDEEESKKKNRASKDIVLPGGWSAEKSCTSGNDTAAAFSNASAIPPRGLGLDTPARAEKTLTESTDSILRDNLHDLSDGEDDSDDNAEFSDAAEDPADLEGSGFASLDAILESPMKSVGQSPKVGLERVPELPTPMPDDPQAEKFEPDFSRGIETNGTGEDWNETTAYWRQLSKSQREEIERAAAARAEGNDDGDVEASSASAGKRSATKKTMVSGPSTPTPRKAPEKPALKTMRESRIEPAPRSDDGAVHMRRSMRSSSGAVSPESTPKPSRMLATMRGDVPRPRPQSDHMGDSRGPWQKRSVRPASSYEPSPPAARGLRTPQSAESDRVRPPGSRSDFGKERGSYDSSATGRARRPEASARILKELAKADDSDSDSSFRKARRKSKSSLSTMDTGRYTMGRSMRGTEASHHEPARPQSPDRPTSKSSFSIRSLSPTGGSLFGRSKARASADSGRTTLRGSPGARPKSTATGARASTGGFRSKFGADSDDSDGDARAVRKFRSRFASDSDSDDEEALTGRRGASSVGLTSVKIGARRTRRDDGDLTDIRNEDGNESSWRHSQKDSMAVPLVPDPADVEKAMAAARKNLGMNGSGGRAGGQEKGKGGAILVKGSPRATQLNDEMDKGTTNAAASSTLEKKRRGFMGSLLRRNRPNPATPGTPTASAAASPASPAFSAAPSTPTASPTATKARRARLRRGDSNLSTLTDPTSNASAAKDGTHWPLPPPIPPLPLQPDQAEKPRPSTSDGVAASFNPEGSRLGRTMRGAPPVTPRGGRPGSPSATFVAGEEGNELGERASEPSYSKRTGKKKKFGILRKAFGLND